MILDLAKMEESREIAAAVCVAGAGIAGLLLAQALRKQRIPVIVLESGGSTQDGREHPFNRTVNLGAPYQGASLGRARCLGGTSTIWGGALIPFLDHDLGARPYLDLPQWPVSMAEVSPYIRAVESLFGLDGSSYGDGCFREIDRVPEDPDFLWRFAKWPRFKNRNVATLLKSDISGDRNLEVWLNATACEFKLDESGRLQSVTAKSLNGHRLEVKARHFVFCAGAIETTRMLLLLDRQHEGLVFEDCDALGRYFHDHISLQAAQLTPCGRELNRLSGFRFAGNAMRSLRFELSPEAQARDSVPSAFAHIGFSTMGNSGFDALRDLLRGLQKNGRPGLDETIGIFRDLPYLARAVWWRLIRRQLLWPATANCELHIVSEQLPRRDSRITLASEPDPFGCPIAAIDWRIGDVEMATLRTFAGRFDGFWKRQRLYRQARLDWLPGLFNGLTVASLNATGIFHPGGTTRLGASRRTAVADGNLRCFAIPNLSLASTSVFPTGASANPTLMLMAFTLRLAAQLGRELSAH